MLEFIVDHQDVCRFYLLTELFQIALVTNVLVKLVG